MQHNIIGMEISELTLDELIIKYQDFLELNLKGKEVTRIADKIQKSPRTIYNYLDTESKMAKDLLTMRAIVEIGIELLFNRGVIYYATNNQG